MPKSHRTHSAHSTDSNDVDDPYPLNQIPTAVASKAYPAPEPKHKHNAQVNHPTPMGQPSGRPPHPFSQPPFNRPPPFSQHPPPSAGPKNMNYPPQTSYRPPPPSSGGELHDARDDTNSFGSCMRAIATFFSYLAVVITSPCCSICFCTHTVKDYERAVMFRMGVVTGGARGPGTFFVLPCIDEFTCLDLRVKNFDIPPQEILTQDSVTAMVDAVVYYRIADPVLAITRVQNYAGSTQLLAASTLRNVLGTKTMAQVLSDREIIAETMKSYLDEATDPWGIKVERVEIKDVKMPVQLQRAMAAEAEAAREAKAKLIAAEGEMAASRALKEAADIMVGSGGALQLRYLQTLNTIAAERNSTIIFPLPMDILSAFMKK